MIAIIKYNGGNVSSVQNALNRLEAESIITDDFELIKKADKVIFPGVGEASSTMKFKRKRIGSVNSDFKTACFGNLSGNAIDV
jgi:glutamine amidotransferase